MSGIVLDAESMAVKKQTQIPAFQNLHSHVEERQ